MYCIFASCFVTMESPKDNQGRVTPPSPFPESRVLIIITGGTICMQPSADGMVPVDNFMERAMAPLPSFNDATPGGGIFDPSSSLHQLCHSSGEGHTFANSMIDPLDTINRTHCIPPWKAATASKSEDAAQLLLAAHQVLRPGVLAPSGLELDFVGGLGRDRRDRQGELPPL